MPFTSRTLERSASDSCNAIMYTWATGYTGISVFVGGYFVPRPSMSSAALLTSYMSEVRFSFQVTQKQAGGNTMMRAYVHIC